ncbi:MAG TPA: hypothetical protein VF331_26210 [Polyangiales bacterium]
MKTTRGSKLNDARPTERDWPYHRLFALKAAQQAERALPIFEKLHPDDDRPRQAIEAIRAWAQGKRKLGMAEVRNLSLAAHAAARAASTEAACFAARAAGHAIATWHVPTHAMAVPYYVCKATFASEAGKARKRTAIATARPARRRRAPRAGASAT